MGKIAFYGDSITNNYGLSYDNGYVALLSALLGLEAFKNAENGRTLQRNVTVENSLENVIFTPTSQQLIDYPVIPYTSDFEYLFLRIGVNDVNFVQTIGFDKADFKAVYLNVIDFFIDQGFAIDKIKIANLAYNENLEYQNQIDAFNEINDAISEICTDTGIQLLDIHGYYVTRGTAGVTDDGLHPNILGSELDADFFYEQITETPPEPPVTILIKGRRISLVSVTPPEPPSELSDLIKDSFDYGFTANISLNNSGNDTVGGQQVNILVDQIGGLNMPYIGDIPVSRDTKPIYYDNGRGIMLLFIPNVTGPRYGTAAFDPAVKMRERWYLLWSTTYAAFEGYFDAPYLGNQGLSGYRTRKGTAWPGDESWFETLYPLTPNKLQLIRQQFTEGPVDIPQAGGDDTSFLMQSRMWIDGQEVPYIMPTNKISAYNLEVGVQTNNEHHGMVMVLYKMGGVIDDATALELTNEIMADYRVGQPLQSPTCSNLALDINGTNVIMSYNFVAYNGVSEDLSEITIEYYFVVAGITFQVHVPELSGMSTFSIAYFEGLTYVNPETEETENYELSGHGLCVEVTVKDTSGNYFPLPQRVAKYF